MTPQKAARRHLSPNGRLCAVVGAFAAYVLLLALLVYGVGYDRPARAESRPVPAARL